MTWKEQLFRDFVLGAHDIQVVADPDGLLRNAESLAFLADRGFEILFYSDPVEFRFEFESKYRSTGRGNEDSSLIVAFEPDQHGFEVIPYDVLKNARRTGVALKDLFPLLDYDVLRGLDPESFSAIFNACRGRSSQLGQKETLEFVLQHAYGIVPSLVSDGLSFLKLAIAMHYGRSILPPVLHKELIKGLGGCNGLKEWPVSQILNSANFLWGFLQERWRIFIENTRGGRDLASGEVETLSYPGPANIPFEHPDIRVYIDNLFQEGLLTPIAWSWDDAIPENWIKVGLSGNQQENLRLRYDTLAQRLKDDMPTETSSLREWSSFSFAYHQLLNLFWQLDSDGRKAVGDQRNQISETTNRIFDQWRRSQYGRLFNASPFEPCMVHHVPHFISTQLGELANAKWAMIVVDGMSVGQWSILKGELGAPSKRVSVEGCVCACIPSITPVSRQSLHCGRLPWFFPDTLDRTDRDRFHWKSFWEARGIDSRLVYHCNYAGEDRELAELESLLDHEPKILAMTVMKIDKIMHGMQLGAEGMWNQCQLWAKQGWLATAVSLLLSRGFNIVITSDHGNVEGIGVGTFSEGSLTETSGQRCRVYNKEVFAQSFAHQHPEFSELICSQLLPPEYQIVSARYGRAFVQKGQRIVTHGGCSLEEVLVPFIRIHNE